MAEKITENVKLHLPESMLRDVQDAAMTDDRRVSEWIRHVLALHLYGLKGTHYSRDCNENSRGDEGLEQ